MKSPIRLSVAGLFASLAASAASAQILEIEPNDSKGQATPAANMPSGQYLLGNSVSGTGIGLDYWLVSTAPAAPGIYRHELALSTTGTAGHTGHIRGLNQTGTAPVCPSTGSGGSAGSGFFTRMQQLWQVPMPQAIARSTATWHWISRAIAISATRFIMGSGPQV